ncbi:hypothetical protein [Micromonospora andamanensis]|nr:hypothetical protein [Micromonospora andamanensis]
MTLASTGPLPLPPVEIDATVRATAAAYPEGIGLPVASPGAT